MDHSANLSTPTDITLAIAGLTALGGLLSCIDPERWASLARPETGDLAALTFLIRSSLKRGLETLGLDAAA